MNPRLVLLGWVIYVAAATAVYALLFNGKLGHGGKLPEWLIATTLVMTVAAIVLLVRWVRTVAIGQPTRIAARDVTGFFWLMAITGALGDILAGAAEYAFGAAALWLMIPIATLTYALCVVWLYRRYFNGSTVAPATPPQIGSDEHLR